MNVVIATPVTVREETVVRIPWRLRPWHCKIGIHAYGELTDDDIQAASQVCVGCGKISHHSASFMVACIRKRDNHLLLRKYAE
jgi:hypothetical protein